MKIPAMRRCIAILTAVLLLLTLAGCAVPGGYAKKPRITLADIRMHDLKTMETAFLLELRILNPNASQLDVRGLECELKIDGNPFAAGVSGDRHIIPPYGSALVPVTVYASVLDMASSILSLARGTRSGAERPESLRYRLDGHIRLAGKNGSAGSVPFASEGELPLAGLR
jgi:LEA14-like dessication related protein